MKTIGAQIDGSQACVGRWLGESGKGAGGLGAWRHCDILMANTPRLRRWRESVNCRNRGDSGVAFGAGLDYHRVVRLFRMLSDRVAVNSSRQTAPSLSLVVMCRHIWALKRSRR